MPQKLFVSSDATSRHNDDGLSGRGPMTSLGEGKDKNYVIQVSRYLLNHLSFPSPALVTARMTALWLISNAVMTLTTVYGVSNYSSQSSAFFLTVRAGTAPFFVLHVQM